MKLFMPAVVVTVLVFSALLTGIAVAQSPREQLQQLTIQLQQAPNDNALRERVIKLGVEIKPAPAIPEEVERRMAHGMAAIKAAKSQQDAGKVFLARENVDGPPVWHNRRALWQDAQKGRSARPQRVKIRRRTLGVR